MWARLTWRLNMEIITLLSRKGGVGKSTTAVHLASYLAKSGNTVLLGDGDANLSAVNWSNRGDQQFPCKVVDFNHIGSAINAAWESHTPFQYAVYDTAANPDDRNLKSLVEGASMLILPTPIEAMCLQGLIETVAEVKAISRGLSRPVQYYALLTRVRPNATSEFCAARDFLKSQAIPTLEARIRESIAFQHASREGYLVDAYRDTSKTAAGGESDYKAMMTEILHLMQPRKAVA
jgi:chromosome partitioning protein